MAADGENKVDDAFRAKWKEQRWVETAREGDFEGCIRDMGVNAAVSKVVNFATAVKPGSEYTLKVVDGAPLPVGRLPATRRASLGQFIRIRHNMMSDKVGAPKTLGDTTPVEDVGDDGRKVMSVAYVKEGGVIETKNVYVDTPELVGFSTYEISEDGKTMKNTITSRNGISFTMAFVPAEAPTGWFS